MSTKLLHEPIKGSKTVEYEEDPLKVKSNFIVIKTVELKRLHGALRSKLSQAQVSFRIPPYSNQFSCEGSWFFIYIFEMLSTMDNLQEGVSFF